MKKQLDALEYLKEFCLTPPFTKGGMCEQLAEAADIAIKAINDYKKAEIAINEMLKGGNKCRYCKHNTCLCSEGECTVNAEYNKDW